MILAFSYHTLCILFGFVECAIFAIHSLLVCEIVVGNKNVTIIHSALGPPSFLIIITILLTVPKNLVIMKKIIFLVSMLALCLLTFAQSAEEKEKIAARGQEAIKMMDNGFVDESIALLEECQMNDPTSSFYPYEIAFAYILKKDYKKAIKILEKLTKHDAVFDQVYQMLGNAYDYSGKPKKAIEAYEKGMKVFPNSGRLYLERSVMHMQAGQINEAVGTLEKGVSVDPMHSSNYYWLARIFMQDSEDEVWGMIYGELFMFLEPNTERSQAISKLLYDTYASQIVIKEDTASVSFSKHATITINYNPKSKAGTDELMTALAGAVKQSFGSMVYEPTLLLSLVGEKEISIESLHRIRSHFIDLYYEKHAEDNPNILFEFQKRIKDEGHFEAYNYWLLGSGGTEETEQWLSSEDNAEKMENFIYWYNNNSHEFQITQSNKFVRP